ncbi:uncharacterized protein B0H18DRAFT_1208097 [Fomitopsis serialis]|uniref:uncharacterized protein n=1 Tax=Fomitopsis serialis TaxID=139415 RepID=UPI0020081B41|nr:uncharacterized protein B0H18DRAFT_1208097 [Neoantrodia serialis]KAH9933370.1 hypothetical protein B0H18DRAFT_1208097 [Neoantrodia serialis]
MVLPRKPLTTYSRRSRARTTNTVNTQTSSPLQPLPADKEDVTVTEMTRRMQKRSRQAAYPSPAAADDPQIGGELQKAKKAKSNDAQVSDDGEPSRAFLALSSALGERVVGQIPSQPTQMSEMFCTPHPSFRSENAMMPSVSSGKEQFSPLPAARHMLSRTSSRRLKENRTRALGTPFSSQPGSRAASPAKIKNQGKVQRPYNHAKSRTLSATLDPATLAHAIQDPLATGADNNASICSATIRAQFDATQDKQQRSTHSLHYRTGSIPIVPSIQTTDDWLAHPTVLSKNAGLEPSPELQSFFLGVPNDASTPPRKRRATTGGVRLETQDFDITLSDMSLDSVTHSNAYTQSATRPSSPESSDLPRRPPVRMRRRTINNPSGDNLFSSVLNFSGSAEEQRASYALDVHGVESRQRTSPKSTHEDHASLATTFSSLNVGLASAFTHATDPGQPTSGHALHRSASLPTLHASPVSAKPGDVVGQTSSDSPVDLGGFDSPDTHLRELFMTLELGDYDDGPSVPANHAKIPEVIINSGYTSPSSVLLPPPKASRSRQQTHRRQRADTIRASDFQMPMAAHHGANEIPGQGTTAQGGAAVTDSASSTRRTRSGTVTLASVAASKAASRRATERSSGGYGQGHASPLRGHRRSNAGLPTIQMRINDEPLKLAPGDDEDDELLLKRGSSID